MKLWVGILFLVVSSQLGINARPLLRPMGEDPKKQQDNVEDHSETEHHGEDNEHIANYGSFREERGTVEENQDTYNEFAFERSPFHFGPIYKESTHREILTSVNSIPLHEKHLSTDNKRVDEDIVDDNDGNSLETQPEEQEHNIGNYSETERDGNEPDSIGHYESVRNGERMVDDGEDSYTEATRMEDEEELGMDYKNAQDDIMSKTSDASNPNSLETQPEEQEGSNHSQSEIKHNGDEFESISRYKEQEGNFNSHHETEQNWDSFESTGQPEEQDGNIDSQSETEYNGDEFESISQSEEQRGNIDSQSETEYNGDEFESISQPEKQRGNFETQSKTEYNGDKFKSISQPEKQDGNIDTQSKTEYNGDEFESISQPEKQRGNIDTQSKTEYIGDEFKSISQPEEQRGNIDTQSKTEYNGDEFESISQLEKQDDSIDTQSEAEYNGDEFESISQSEEQRGNINSQSETEYNGDEFKSISQPEKQRGIDTQSKTEYNGDEFQSISEPEKQRANIDTQSEAEHYGDEFQHNSQPEKQNGYTGSLSETEHSEDEFESISQPGKQDGNTDSSEREHNFESISQIEKQEGNVENQSETKHNGIEFESTDQYGSVGNEERMAGDGEDGHTGTIMNDKRQSLEAQPEEQEANNYTQHSGIDFKAIGQYGPFTNGNRMVGGGGDGYNDTTRREDEEHDGVEDEKVAVLETLHVEQKNKIVDDSETENDEYELESIGRYQRSPREGRGMDEDFHNEFSFRDHPFYVRPVYTDSTYLEVKAPEHLVPLHEKHLITDNKKADDDLGDGYKTKSLETQPEEQKDNVDTEQNGIDFASVSHYGSVRNEERLVGNGEDGHTGSARRENEKHHRMNNEKEDVLATPREEHEDKIAYNSETEYDEYELESIDRYQGLAREVRGVVEEEGDVYGEFPFKHPSFYVRPIYADTTYLEESKPEHAVPLHEKHLSTYNKRADRLINDNKPVAYKTKYLETQPKEQENNDTGSTRREDEKHLTVDNEKVDILDNDKVDFLGTSHVEQENKTVNNNETEHDENGLESIGLNQRSVSDARGVAEEEDVHAEFPFEHHPFYIPPIYSDLTHLEEKTPEHPVPLNEKYNQRDNNGDDDGKPYAHKTKSPVKQEDKTDAEHNVKEFESIGHYESVRDDLVEDNEDIHADITRREDENYGVDNKNFKVEGETIERPDGPNANSLERQSEEQVDNIVKNSETEHDEDEFESIGRYHGSARKVRSIVEKVEDLHEKFPFDHYPFYARPIYTDSMYLEVKAREHLVPLHEQDHGMDNRKKVSNGDQAGPPGHRRVSWESHEDTAHEAETTSRESKTPQGTENDINKEDRVLFEDIHSFGDVYNVTGLTTKYRVKERDVSQENEGDFWNEDIIAEYTDNEVHDDLISSDPGNKGNDIRGDSYILPHNHEKYLVSRDDDNLQGVSIASGWNKDDEDNFQASGYHEEARNSEKDEGDEDEFLESSDDFEEIEVSDRREDDEDAFQTPGSDLEEAVDLESMRDEVDEDEFFSSGENFKETEASDWQYSDEEKMETSGGDLEKTDALEGDKDDEEDFQVFEDETKIISYAAFRANDRKDNEFVDGVDDSGHATQLRREDAKGLGDGHSSDNVEQS